MRKKYKSWIQQLSESYIRQALREAQQPPSEPMFPPGGPPPEPTFPPSSPPPSEPMFPPTRPSTSMVATSTPSDGTPTPNNGPSLGTLKSGKRITQPAKGFVYPPEGSLNGVVYTYYPGPPTLLVVTQNGQSVTYFWGQNGWVTN
jgi:hypothetical protein